MKNNIIILVLTLLISSNNFAQKWIEMDQSPNFRSLSGITNTNGKKIKEGLIYRSGIISKLSATDIEKFNALTINTIVDFRTDAEINKDPDYIPQGKKIQTTRALIGAIDDKEMANFTKILMAPNFNEEILDSLMIQTNSNFVNRIKDFKPFFDEISKKESVVLFHCTAGKDRTGFASALFLSIMDVSEDEIMKDYLRSNEAIAKTDFSKYKAYGIPEERMAKLMAVKPIYLETALNNSSC